MWEMLLGGAIAIAGVIVGAAIRASGEDTKNERKEERPFI